VLHVQSYTVEHTLYSTKLVFFRAGNAFIRAQLRVTAMIRSVVRRISLHSIKNLQSKTCRGHERTVLLPLAQQNFGHQREQQQLSPLRWTSLFSTAASPTASGSGKVIPAEYGHVTGLEREEIEAQLEGKSRFETAPPRGPFGTAEAPAIVESQFDERIVGCSGGYAEEEHDVLWFKLKKDSRHECHVCGQVFELKVVGEGGLPGAHH